MAEEKPVVTDPGPDDEQPIEGVDGQEELEEIDELYDANGKPLPWANSKRFRRLYREAKAGKEVTGVLAEAGLTSNQLRQELTELADYRAAYRAWQEQKAQGETTPKEDDAAAEVRAREKEIAARLKALGFVTKEDIESARNAESRERNANNVASTGHQHLHSLLTNEGIITDDMDDDDVEDVMVQWDAAVGHRLMKDKADTRLYQSGDKKVITKHFNDALASSRKRGSAPAAKRSSISNLPSRVSSGVAPRAKSGKAADEPQSVREAAAQMFAEMSGK